MIDVQDDILETLAEYLPGLRGPTREPLCKVTLVGLGLEVDGAGLSTDQFYAYEALGAERRVFRVRVLVEPFKEYAEEDTA